MSDIQLVDPSLGEAEKRRVEAVIEDGQLADGPEVRQFESEFADFCGTRSAVATSNGTTALHTALRAVGIGPGDVVITTPFSFVATANAVRHCGATPVFADVDPRTYTLDPEAVEQVLRTAEGEVDALLPVHLYGLPADMDPLLDLAETYDLAVVEDAAQAHGARYGDRPVGSMGDAGCFSFYPTKNMTTGEGGMIVTDRMDVAARARRFIDHGRASAADSAMTDDGQGVAGEHGQAAGDGGGGAGQGGNGDGGNGDGGDGNGGDGDGGESRRSDGHLEVGHNFRMTSIAAAIGRVQLSKLPEFTRRRRANAATLSQALSSAPDIELPAAPPGRRHVYHQYTIRCPDREAMRSGLAAKGIDSGVYYPTPIHREPAYEGVEADLPVAERAATEVLSLPVHPSLTKTDVRAVAEAVRETLQDQRGLVHE